MIEYPQDVIRELASLRSQAEKGISILSEAEKKHVTLALEADRIEALAYLEAGGSIPERQAVAKLKALEVTQEAELARVEVNRIKLKLKSLSEAQMNVQTQARMVELQWKTAGVGER